MSRPLWPFPCLYAIISRPPTTGESNAARRSRAPERNGSTLRSGLHLATRNHRQGGCPRRTALHNIGWGERLPRALCRHNGIGIHPGGRHLDGHPAIVPRVQHPREQHRSNRRLGRGKPRGGRDLHDPGHDHSRGMDRIQLPADNAHRRIGRYDGCAVYHPAATRSDCRHAAALPRGRCHSRSAEGGRHRGGGHQIHRVGFAHRCCVQVRRHRTQALGWRFREGAVRGRVDRLFRNESLSCPGGCRLHRRPQHCGVDLHRRSPELAGGDSHHRRHAGHTGGGRQRSRGRQPALVHTNALSRCGRDGGGRILGVDLGPQELATRHLRRHGGLPSGASWQRRRR